MCSCPFSELQGKSDLRANSTNRGTGRCEMHCWDNKHWAMSRVVMISPASGKTDLILLELSALSHGMARAHAPDCATLSRMFPSSTSVNHIAGYDKLLRGFVKAFL